MSHVVTEGNGKSCVNDVKRFRGVRLLMTEFDCQKGHDGRQI